MKLLTLVILLGTLGNIPDDYKCTDKFLLQWSVVENANPHIGRIPLQLSSADAFAYLTQLEKDIVKGTKPKQSILEKKIRCTFGPPIDAENSDFSTTATFEKLHTEDLEILKNTALTKNTKEQGVSVKIVVLLCLVSLVIALQLSRGIRL